MSSKSMNKILLIARLSVSVHYGNRDSRSAR